jgi:hypothetical protein
VGDYDMECFGAWEYGVGVEREWMDMDMDMIY